MTVVFQSNFNAPLNLMNSPATWSNLQESGTKVEIVTDPTSSLDADREPRGGVVKVSIQGKSVQKEWLSTGRKGGLYWRTGYPGWDYGQTLRAPSGIQVDIFIPADLYGIGLHGVHRLNKIHGDRTSVAGYEIYRGDVLVLVARDGQGNDKRVHLRHGLFQSGQWNTLRLDFEVDGSVIPFVNGQNAYQRPSDLLKVPVDDEYDAGFIDGHAGLIFASQNEQDGFKDGQYLLNDNFTVFEYQ